MFNALTSLHIHALPLLQVELKKVAGSSVIFVNENKNENGEKRENNKLVNEN